MDFLFNIGNIMKRKMKEETTADALGCVWKREMFTRERYQGIRKKFVRNESEG